MGSYLDAMTKLITELPTRQTTGTRLVEMFERLLRDALFGMAAA